MNLHGATEDKIDYARRVLAENPTHLEARLYIIGTEQDNAVAAAMYRQLAKIHPDSPYPLERLGGRLHYDNPVEAIAALKKAQALGSLQADMDLGRASERLGNYKAAWVHYYKYLMRYPDGQIPLSHMARLSEGQPHYPPIQLETTIPVDHAQEERTPGPPDHAPSIKRTENDVDGGNALPLNESSPRTPSPTAEETYNARAAAAKQAYEEFRELGIRSREEFQEFINWVENAKNDTPDAQDFLSQQMRSFLAGTNSDQVDPDRLTRAFDMLNRHGLEEGLKRLEETDPEIAEQIQRSAQH